MARLKSGTLTDLELAIMQIVWNNREVMVEDIRQILEKEGRPLALPSIRTMLSILQGKGYVTRRKVGRGHAYKAIVPQEKAQENIIKELSRVKNMIRQYEKEAGKK